MAKIPGKLLANLDPNGNVRVVFVASLGVRNERPFTATDLDAAEIVFMTCGLTPERAATLRAELQRHKVASVETCVDDVVTEKFRYAGGY